MDQTCKVCNELKPLDKFPSRDYHTAHEQKISHERRCYACKYAATAKPRVREAKDAADQVKMRTNKAAYPTMSLRAFHKACGLTMSLPKFYSLAKAGEIVKILET